MQRVVERLMVSDMGIMFGGFDEDEDERDYDDGDSYCSCGRILDDGENQCITCRKTEES